MTNADQQEFWDGEAGPIWVAQMQTMDRTLAPVLDQVLAAAHIQPGDKVLDIGCGAGTSTAAAARLAGTMAAPAVWTSPVRCWRMPVWPQRMRPACRSSTAMRRPSTFNRIGSMQ